MPPFPTSSFRSFPWQVEELAGQGSALGAGMGPGAWGSWHQAVTLVESQCMKGAFPPHLQSLCPGHGFLP